MPDACLNLWPFPVILDIYPVIFLYNTWIIICIIYVCTEAAKEEEAEDDDDMDGFQTDDDDDDADGSDKEMGVDAEDGDEADSIRLQKLAAQVYIILILKFIIGTFLLL